VTHHTYNIETARRAIAVGIYIFPCDPVSKKPLVKWREWSSNEEHVLGFWESFPAAIVGIDCGKSGLFVIDLDRNHADGVDGCAAFDALLEQTGEDFPTDGPATKTPRGGFHIYLRQPVGRDPLGNSNRNLPPGIDVRGDGGFVIAPGSVMADGTYYESEAGWPDLCEAFVNGTIPVVPDWFIYGLEWRDEHGPCGDEVRETALLSEGDTAERYRRGIAIARLRAGDLAIVREGGRNVDLNSATITIAGRAWWSGITKSECWDLMVWACGINKLIADDGWPAFTATFESAWNAGLRKTIAAPRDRLDDTCGIKINLKSRMKEGVR
jgi:hypothetical protein